MSEYRRQSQILLLLGYFRQHPGMVLSISYALLTLCGILYSVSFYEQFDIAILKLANISDLLIFGLSEPAAILMFCGGLLVAIWFDLASQYYHKKHLKWREQPKSIKRTLMMSFFYTPRRNEYVMLAVLVIFILYAYIFVSGFAEWQSKRIKQGYGDQVLVTSNVLGVEAKQLTLLGSTTRYLLTYNQKKDLVNVIPIEKIETLSAVPVERDSE